jgi:hypothetical protein
MMPALYLAALIGAGLLAAMLVRLRLYLLGSRGVGVLLVDGLLLAQVVLVAAFGFIVARLAGWDPGRAAVLRLWTVLLLILAAKPWVTIVRLTWWEFPATRPGALWRRLRARRAAP